MNNKTTIDQSNMLMPMVVFAVLFFVFGFITWLNGSLIPFLKIVCNLNDFEALYVTFTFYIAYTVMAFPMAAILRRTGYRNGMVLGLMIMVVGALLFVPAAMAAEYFFFLGALFILGTGLTILQTAANPFIIYLGPRETAAKRIAVMGLINKVAGVVVPIVFSALVLSDVNDASEFAILVLSEAEVQELSERLIMPYIGMAVIFVVLIGLLYMVKIPTLGDELEKESDNDEKKSIFDFPHTVLGAVAIFSYLGVEVIAGDTINLYGSTLYMEEFSVLTAFTMSFMVVGYIIGVAAIPRVVNQSQALGISAFIGVMCIIGVVMSSIDDFYISEILWGWTGLVTLPNSIFFVAMMGLANAMVWPSVWPLALDGLGKFTAQGSALLIVGVAGGALIPLAFGRLTLMFGEMQLAYLICAPCYLYILFYAFKGHKIRQWK
ncbi:sugar MFS transporter [Pseudemcibacter aquimaris]|uniref:sugar MFS transporter n=1 Tax=Pseudemcibacter aquimaris TaxID=2857064 RepID=UPI002011D585|nr:sugar MFS transporter [Pseudemcibacter aquimaris]MCC3860033.1 sugar MFS transporter [Pseudemcibacter aquimaris]WDU57363.1 sugar MFS transporter [Pseudemcibacter aquimaris]